MDDIGKDGRFSHISKDPRFRSLKHQHRKVKVDKRFQGMFNEKKFKLKYTVDKRGRPIHTTTNENLKRFYELNDSDSDSGESSESDEENEKKQKKKSKEKGQSKDKKEIKESQYLEDETLQKNKKNKKKIIDSDSISKKEKCVSSKKEKTTFEVIGNGSSSLKDNTSTSDTLSKDSSLQNSDRVKQMKKEDAEDDDSSEEEDGSSASAEESGEDEEQGGGSDEDEEDSDESEDESDSDRGAGKMLDLARGVGAVESSSSSDEEEEEEAVDKEDELDHKWGEIDKDAPQAESITNRLAVCNMDWDRIKARDLMVLFSSFTPTGGTVTSVKIFPSEFGKERMAKEKAEGPTEVVEAGRKQKGQDEVYHREQLRKYQLARLKYFYAVVECDSGQTANAIYEQCDGLEYETSSNRLDIRFIPEGMEFEDEATSVMTSMPDAATYKPSLYTSSALNQSKVELTWDETDKERVALTMRKFSKEELEEIDMRDYLASSSSGEEDAYGGLIEEPDFGSAAPSEKKEDQKLNKLLQSIKGEDEGNKKDVDMEVTWEPGLKETTEALVKKSKKAKDGLSPWEQFLEKKKEKNRLRREEAKKKKTEEVLAPSEGLSDEDLPEGVDLNDPYFKEELGDVAAPSSKAGKKKKKKKKGGDDDRSLTETELKEKKEREAELAMLMMDEDDGRQHFNLEAIMEAEKLGSKKRKKKLKKKAADVAVVEDTFKMDVTDDRFRDIYNNPHFNIDPSAPEFKKTKATEALIHEKLERRKKPKKHKLDQRTTEDGKESKVAKLEMSNIEKSGGAAGETSLAMLVKSVKAKTKSLQQKRTKK